jgi:hypothetical protein
MSTDFIFIPSSIAFYLIMSFMPIISMIIVFYQIPSVNSLFIYEGKDLLKETLSKFIPGISFVFEELKNISKFYVNNSFFTGSIF